MSKVQFELNIFGLNELMRSEWMQAQLENAGQAVAKAAGEGFDTNTHVANWVAITNVYPTTRKARKFAMKNGLLKAAGACGLRFDK